MLQQPVRENSSGTAYKKNDFAVWMIIPIQIGVDRAMSTLHPRPLPNPSQKRLNQILDPSHPLCKEDVVWVLELIKKKVADGDPAYSDLPQPQLLKHFSCFAEAAMLLIHHRPGGDQEIGRLRLWLAESVRELRH
jgi:hypothetical protein